MQNLIVFAKKPILGRVKTRLAKDLGKVETLKIYTNMLELTMHLAWEWMKRSLARQVHWFWDEIKTQKKGKQGKFSVESCSFNLPALFLEHYQMPNADLGERMALAFKEIFFWKENNNFMLGSNWKEKLKENVDRSSDLLDKKDNPLPPVGKGQGVVIIGTDCPDLNLDILEQAFDGIYEKDIAIGPAKDGGYYLLGMRDFYPELFCSVEWSTETVFQKTMKNAEDLGLYVKVLPVLRDVDTIEDLLDE